MFTIWWVYKEIFPADLWTPGGESNCILLSCSLGWAIWHPCNQILVPSVQESMAQAGGRWQFWDIICCCHSEWAKRKDKKGNFHVSFLISVWVAKGSPVRRKFALLAVRDKVRAVCFCFLWTRWWVSFRGMCEGAEESRALTPLKGDGEGRGQSIWGLFKLIKHWRQHHLHAPQGGEQIGSLHLLGYPCPQLEYFFDFILSVLWENYWCRGPGML